MKRSLRMIAGVLLLAAVFGAGFLTRGITAPMSRVSATPSPTVSGTVSPSVIPTASPVAHVITMTDSGPAPRTLAVRVGDVVVFRNSTSRAFWPASDPHPTHRQCPWLDAARGLHMGEEYAAVIPEAGTCSYHDHLVPAEKARTGTVTAL